MKKFWNAIFSQPLSREAFKAYFNRLPDGIEVSWFRDGKFIVGNVKAGDNKFVTQGLDADNFVDMVNDAIITVFAIPRQYYNVIRQTHTYLPSQEQLQQLQNVNIKKSTVSFAKNREVVQLA